MTLLTRRLIWLTGALLAGVIALHAATPAGSPPARDALAQLPARVGGWHSAGDVGIDPDSLTVLNADDYVSRAYVSGANTADLFIAYYASQQQGATMHSPLNCLPAAGWEPLSTERVQIPARPAPVNATRAVIQKGLDRQLVIYWYQSHGRTIADEFSSKAYLVLDSLRMHRSDAALVRVVTAMTDGGDRVASDFTQALRPLLDRYIPE